ncbi:MAG: ATP-dependent sacrificial sulfur transferase LarE [Candidatus Altiarchaeota archaeon]
MLDEKYEKLKKLILAQGSVVVAFSGGVDSTVLAKVSYDVLGQRAAAVTLDSKTIPRRELADAIKLAKKIGIKHKVLPHSELASEEFSRNPEDRCYYCKKELSQALKDYAGVHGFDAVLEGTNASELCGHRPGARALFEEGVLSPLAGAGFSKQDVRELAVRLGLPNAGKPSAACLSSRIPYGQRISKEGLGRVEAAEDYLKGIGVAQVRVRLHGDVARIEAEPEDFSLILDARERLAERFVEIGFKYVALDLLGYRSGSMNE